MITDVQPQMAQERIRHRMSLLTLLPSEHNKPKPKPTAPSPASKLPQGSEEFTVTCLGVGSRREARPGACAVGTPAPEAISHLGGCPPARPQVARWPWLRGPSQRPPQALSLRRQVPSLRRGGCRPRGARDVRLLAWPGRPARIRLWAGRRWSPQGAESGARARPRETPGAPRSWRRTLTPSRLSPPCLSRWPRPEHRAGRPADRAAHLPGVRGLGDSVRPAPHAPLTSCAPRPW